MGTGASREAGGSLNAIVSFEAEVRSRGRGNGKEYPRSGYAAPRQGLGMTRADRLRQLPTNNDRAARRAFGRAIREYQLDQPSSTSLAPGSCLCRAGPGTLGKSGDLRIEPTGLDWLVHISQIARRPD